MPPSDPLRDRVDVFLCRIALAESGEHVEAAVVRVGAVLQAASAAGRTDLLRMVREATDFHRARFLSAPPAITQKEFVA